LTSADSRFYGFDLKNKQKFQWLDGSNFTGRPQWSGEACGVNTISNIFSSAQFPQKVLPLAWSSL